MASSRKKLEDKHLKILRDLAAQPANKECFDCHQRGPTYINMAIGSFVCTSCSGILRGLNPPHRVKSISMATFTPDEIDFIRSRGNQTCASIWMGLADSSNAVEPSSKDDHAIREFMIKKYEKKLYYVEPSSVPSSSSSSSPLSSPVSPVSPPPVKPLSSLVGAGIRPLAVSSSSRVPPPISLPKVVSSITSSASVDLLADVRNTSDPWSSPSQSSTGFANFDNNPAFSSSNTNTGMTSSASFPPPTSNTTGSDKYAALADLDSIFKTQGSQPQVQWSSGGSVGWSSDVGAPPDSSASVQASSNSQSTEFANFSQAFSPGFDSSTWRTASTTSTTAAFGSPGTSSVFGTASGQPNSSTTGMFPGASYQQAFANFSQAFSQPSSSQPFNPFTNTSNPFGTESTSSSEPSSTAPNGWTATFPSKPAPSNSPWQNPFMGGAGGSNSNSSNPFL